jgi:threonine/homoserine/homoserine lactone efflux protein
MVLILPPLIFMIEAGWYSLVAFLFSANQPRRAYLRSKRWVDRAAGTMMGLLGLKLVIEAAPAS